MSNQKPQTEPNEQKEVIAVSKAHYRGFEILETPTGCCFFIRDQQYDFIGLDEASACIDAIYASAARRVTM